MSSAPPASSPSALRTPDVESRHPLEHSLHLHCHVLEPSPPSPNNPARPWNDTFELTFPGPSLILAIWSLYLPSSASSFRTLTSIVPMRVSVWTNSQQEHTRRQRRRRREGRAEEGTTTDGSDGIRQGGFVRRFRVSKQPVHRASVLLLDLSLKKLEKVGSRRGGAMEGEEGREATVSSFARFDPSTTTRPLVPAGGRQDPPSLSLSVSHRDGHVLEAAFSASLLLTLSNASAACFSPLLYPIDRDH